MFEEQVGFSLNMLHQIAQQNKKYEGFTRPYCIFSFLSFHDHLNKSGGDTEMYWVILFSLSL